MGIEDRVHELYWNDDKNCAITTLKILSEIYDLDVTEQIYDSLTAMPGIGKHGLTCGIVVGAVMFMGLYGKKISLSDEVLVHKVHELVDAYQGKFGSTKCSVLRPEGFKTDNPPHLCEPLTKASVEFLRDWIGGSMG